MSWDPLLIARLRELAGRSATVRMMVNEIRGHYPGVQRDRPGGGSLPHQGVLLAASRRPQCGSERLPGRRGLQRRSDRPILIALDRRHAKSLGGLRRRGAACGEREHEPSGARRLVGRHGQLIRLFTPPMDPGYIKGYLPGIRENGGQYTHAATWVVPAFAVPATTPPGPVASPPAVLPPCGAIHRDGCVVIWRGSAGRSGGHSRRRASARWPSDPSSRARARPTPRSRGRSRRHPCRSP